MEISSLLVRVAFLSLPGIIGSRLYRKLRGRADRKTWEDFTEILLFAVLSYLVWLAPLKGMATWFDGATSVIQGDPLRAFVDESEPIEWLAILFSCLASVGLAVLGSLSHQRKWVTRSANLFGVSNRFGDEDVWDHFHTLKQAEWVTVRDHKLDLVYFGRVVNFSDMTRDRELLLADVDVYDNTGSADKLYSAGLLYVARDRFDLSIEVPRPADNNSGVGETERHT